MTLSHICFADDILVLCHGDEKSVIVVKKSLDEFSQVSGLFPNLNKSTIFFGSVPAHIQGKIINILPFTIGNLPMKYLGVPLLAKRLSISDCKCLIDKIKAKVYNWKNRKLSYAGRLQLVASVLSSMQIYWMSVYILPSGVIEEIERCLKCFLWSQSDNCRGKAKVAWKDVCIPKNQGGLGLKSLKEWNVVLVIKNLWRILTQKDSLWGKWVNVVKLNGESIWDTVGDYKDSWGWRHLMNLRQKVYPHVDVAMVNGEEVIKWIANDGNKVEFSTKQVWNDLRSNRNVVNWYHVICFKSFDPKHAFVLWLAMLNRLNTQDRVQKWLPNQVLKCPFCSQEPDSISHLFFLCKYSAEIWKSMKSKLIFKGLTGKLQEIVQRLAMYPFTCKIWNIVNRLVLAASVYYLWQERNFRIFKHKKRSVEELIEVINSFIRLKLLLVRVKCSDAVLKVASLWGLIWINNRYSLN
ncbi:uncharacterized protein [Rutidosis leptorrhynchoides]|uniref:uncharacterized protein n=1 Tax=Rutidosis leptorrhynchoides TaxID=125765 RepID=UPI003A99EE9E